jgi:hypothetical protein
MGDILASFFHTLYLWTVAFLSSLSISVADFLVHFLFLVRCFPLYTSSVLGAPYAFNKTKFTYKKKKWL